MGIFFDDPHEKGHKQIAELLGCARANPELTEAKFRNALQNGLSAYDIVCKREAGVGATGTKIDLYFEHSEADHLVTIKRGVNEQKIKVLLGEMVIISQYWQLTPGAKACYVYPVFFGKFEPKHEGYLEVFAMGLEQLDRIEGSAITGIDMTVVHPPSAKEKKALGAAASSVGFV